MLNPEKAELLTITAVKILEQLSMETQGISIKELQEKYYFSKGLKREIKNGFTQCYILNICELLDIFKIRLSDFMRMIEDELGEDFSIID